MNAGAFAPSAEHANAALELANDVGDAATAARALGTLGTIRLFAEPPNARPGLERAIVLARASGDTWAEVEAVQQLSNTYLFQGENDSCRRVLDEIRVLEERQGYTDQLARGAVERGLMLTFEGRLAEAREYLLRALVLADDIGEPVFAAYADAELGLVEVLEGDPKHALERILVRLDRALSCGAGVAIPVLQLEAGFAEIALGDFEAGCLRLEACISLVLDQDVFVSGWGLAHLADARRQLGDPLAAQQAAGQGLAISQSVGNRVMAAVNRLVLGRLAATRTDWSAAEQHAHALLDECAGGGHVMYVADALEALAEVAAGRGNPADAVRLLASAGRARREIGLVRWRGDGAEWERVTARLRDGLGGAFERAWSDGEGLALEDAIAWERRARGERKRPQIGWESLTPTEERVVALAAQGLTNPQIGERMFISRTTVKTHLEHIYAKLGIHGRTELAAAAGSRENRT